MADNKKDGVAPSYEDNVMDGVTAAGDNCAEQALGAVGDPNYRGPSFGHKAAYALPDGVPD